MEYTVNSYFVDLERLNIGLKINGKSVYIAEPGAIENKSQLEQCVNELFFHSIVSSEKRDSMIEEIKKS